ncbi:MAG: hypothetical protein QG653_565 [Patescibacteria group bacterium]|nr:hypothetical protein [Patescibacteria group bacterium]
MGIFVFYFHARLDIEDLGVASPFGRDLYFLQPEYRLRKYVAKVRPLPRYGKNKKMMENHHLFIFMCAILGSNQGPFEYQSNALAS